MSFVTKSVPRDEAAFLLPVLADAEEGEERIRAALLDPACLAYAAWADNQLAGAALVRWTDDESSEILYIAVPAELRGHGYGKQLIHALQEELRTRGGHTLLVGTATASLDNIAFYQKCGFRMLAIKRDYFAYIQPPISENGIPLRDMIMFSYELT